MERPNGPPGSVACLALLVAAEQAGELRQRAEHVRRVDLCLAVGALVATPGRIAVGDALS